MKSFYDYVIQRYYFTHGPEAGLAVDMLADKKDFPKVKGSDPEAYKILKDYLRKCGACTDCMTVFEKCFNEYMTEVKS